MKFPTNALVALALAAAVSAPATAMVSPSLQSDVLSAVGANSNVRVQIDGSTVTLTGYAEDAYAVSAAGRVALAGEGVDRVINNVFRTN